MGTPPIQMANLGMADSLILMVMALVVFGPRRLPQIGRQIGKLMYEFRKASNDFKFQMEEELRLSEDADRRKKEEERLQALTVAAPPQPALAVETPSTSAEPLAEEPNLRIQPPSTGEQVAAARPNAARATESDGAVSGDTEPPATPETSAADAMVSEGSPVEQIAPVPEQAAHHG